jgi:Type IV secretion system pilin
MRQLIKHKLKLLYGLILVSLVTSAALSGSVLAAKAICYTNDATTYSPVSCDLLMNNQAGFKPADTNPATCYTMRTSPQGVNIGTVDCTAAATNGKDLSNIDFSTPAVSTVDPATLKNADKTALETITSKYLNPLIVLLSACVGIFVVIGVIVGGIQYTTSDGDPQRVAAAKGRIIKALIALFSFLFLYAFWRFILPTNIIGF